MFLKNALYLLLYIFSLGLENSSIDKFIRYNPKKIMIAIRIGGIKNHHQPFP